MRFDFKRWLVGVSFTIGFLACTGPQPDLLRLRLKTLQGSGTTKEYTYDSQNRLATINSSGSDGLVVNRYDDSLKTFVQVNQYPIPTDRTTGNSFRFPYSFNRSSFLVQIRPIKNSVVDNSYSGVISSAQYGYDNLSAEHLSIYRWKGVTTGGSGLMEYDYWYSGENLTRLAFHYPNNYADTTRFDYDDKINPFFLSTDPTISDAERFSRNNVTKQSAYFYPSKPTPDRVYSYEYEYNQQGFPTKRTVKQDGKELAVYTYTYESY